MGYKIVAVGPLKPFPLLSFGLANVASLDDTKMQISARNRYADTAEIAELEERWPKIEPALKLHLARQERRLTHFKTSCRFFECYNPHPLKSVFCGSHRWVKGQMASSDYAMLSDPKYRVKVV